MMLTARALISRVLAPLIRAVEGQPRLGPWRLPVTGGFLPADVGGIWNWWQCGYSPVSGERSSIVEACVSSYAQTISMLPGNHFCANDRGGRDRIMTSALARILRNPNAYETISDFLLNAVRSLYLTGNCYALALRSHRFEIEEVHLMDPDRSAPAVAQNGEVFYALQGNDVIERQLNEKQILVPARDVLHIKLHSNRHYPKPLVGETPLAAAFGDIASYEAMRNQQDQFFRNQARPSAVLATDLNLDATQVQQLRDRWNDQAKGLSAGGTPILTHGLKVQPWSTTGGKELQIAELMKLSVEQVALVFRVPLQILGIGGAPLGSTEALMRFWLASGLGFALNHVELAFDKLFGLAGQPTEYTEFDTRCIATQ